MTNLVNLLRDQVHSAPGQAFVGLNAAFMAVGNRINMNSSGIVNQTFGSANNSLTGVTGAGTASWQGVGVLMSQPIVDSTPYRVKAYATCSSAVIYVFLGYAPGAPATINTIESVVAYPITGYESNVYKSNNFDEIILVPGNQNNNPVAFGIAIAAGSGESAQLSYSISVQNLAKTAPTFAASMS